MDECGICGGDNSSWRDTDGAACNYNPNATFDDGGCDTDLDGDGICDELEYLAVRAACNYQEEATEEEKLCFLLPRMGWTACNYDEGACRRMEVASAE